jgi:hypothetical protein
VALDGFDVPAALVDLSRNVFLAWNERFLGKTRLLPDEIVRTRVDELLGFEWPGNLEPTECDSAPAPVHFVACTVKPAGTLSFGPGQAFKREDDFVLILLESQISSLTAEQFITGLREGKEEENERMRGAFKKILSRQVFSTLDTAQQLKEKLEKSGGAEKSDIQTIAQTIDHLSAAVGKALAEDGNPEAK